MQKFANRVQKFARADQRHSTTCHELRAKRQQLLFSPNELQCSFEEDSNNSILEKRRIRNRQSAELSRKRKAEHLYSVEKRVKVLSEANDILIERIRQLENENSLLKMKDATHEVVACSKAFGAKSERGLIFLESAVLLSLFYNIFSQQPEILAPLLIHFHHLYQPHFRSTLTFNPNDAKMKTRSMTYCSTTSTSIRTPVASTSSSLMRLMRYPLMISKTISKHNWNSYQFVVT